MWKAAYETLYLPKLATGSVAAAGSTGCTINTSIFLSTIDKYYIITYDT